MLGFLYRQRFVGFEPPGEPHFDPETLSLFKRLLGQSKAYLEYGGGGSTMLAHKQDIPTVTIESDQYYAATLRRTVGPRSKVEVISVDIGLTKQWGRPIFTKPTKRALRKWANYATSPFPVFRRKGVFPDLVLVDGRFRRACALTTAREALSTGIDTTIIFDDYYTPGREHYYAVEKYLGHPERIARSAIFRVSRTNVAHIPPLSAVSEASQDFE